MMQPKADPILATRLPCYLFDSNHRASVHLASLIADTIRQRNAFGHRAAIGLSTGSTVIGAYRELVRLHREENLDFSNVAIFGFEEYFGLDPSVLQSRRRWLHENLLDHLNVPKSQTYLLDPMVQPAELENYCRQYEDSIRQAGSLDIAICEIGSNGRVAFNEPFGNRDSKTRLVTLDSITRKEASSDFFHFENVPTQALSVGLETIREAKKVILMAFGENRAEIVRQTVEDSPTDRIPASLLGDHYDISALLDHSSAELLTARATPWLLGTVGWNEASIKQAVLWLCKKTGKALLKLDSDDFREHGLYQLLREKGNSSKVAHRVFRQLMQTIEYHPAGTDPKRVLIFSPHPDDDVISMGGTMVRLVRDGHETHVAYMTSGNIAVFDHDARQAIDLLTEMNRQFEIDDRLSPELEENVDRSLANKESGENDSEKVLKIKELIRWSEAKSAADLCGIPEEQLHFLALPFYQTGTVKKNEPGSDDIEQIRRLIDQVAPEQIYVAGDLSDPHGTHRICADLIFKAFGLIESQRGTRPEVLLYRGAWQEWPLHEIEIAVPLSPSDLKQKKQAIFRHESQKDSALFPGPDDPREFWQRAEDRNRETADLYNQIGLPEYYALEAFVRYTGREV
jgi:glucosamine-6-phosphate deaminase